MEVNIRTGCNCYIFYRYDRELGTDSPVDPDCSSCKGTGKLESWIDFKYAMKKCMGMIDRGMGDL